MFIKNMGLFVLNDDIHSIIVFKASNYLLTFIRVFHKYYKINLPTQYIPLLLISFFSNLEVMTNDWQNSIPF